MLTTTNSPRLLTAEQFVQHIRVQFGLDLAKAYQGRSPALQRYLLPLGGLDHDTVYERDRQLKVQNLLAVQAIAWEAALRIMEQEQKPKLARVFGSKSPGSIEPETEPAHWQDALQSFFLLLHGRPPEAAESAFFEQQFRQLQKAEATTLQAWTAVVYTLLASVEYWQL